MKHDRLNMGARLQRSVRATLAIVAIAVGAIGTASAADVEVYQTASATNPNVLFVIDNSSSMRGTDGTGVTRLDRFREALKDTVRGVSGVNVGLLVYAEDDYDYMRMPVHSVDSSALSPNGQTHKEDLLRALTNIRHSAGTPTLMAFYESALYFSGHTPNRKGHSFHPGTVNSSGRYSAPNAQCGGQNYIVLMTDGSPNSAGKKEIEKVRQLAGVSRCDWFYSGSLTCAKELTVALKDGKITQEPVYMFTVGFGRSDDWLKEMANIGRAPQIAPGSNYVSLDQKASEDALKVALNGIFQEIGGGEPVKAVTQAVPASNFQGTAHADDMYLGVFAVGSGELWPGNVHKFKLKANGQIRDKNGQNAVDPKTGFFKETAKSFWTNRGNDGGSADKGGAKEQLPAPNARNIYTYIEGNDKRLKSAKNAFTKANVHGASNRNGALKKEDFGVGSSGEVESLVDWARRGDQQGYGQLMDPLHTSVHLVTYDEQPGKPQYVIYGDNGGFLRVLEAKTGKEVWSFIPQDLLQNLSTIRDNKQGYRTRYGVDGPISIYKDTAQERVYVYFGLRRGGDRGHIYALDITDIKDPEMAWSISAGDPGFGALGQTWSRLVQTQVVKRGDTVPMLMFGGGYDPDNDRQAVRTPDTIGNALYMVNSWTGKLKWSASDKKAGSVKYAHSDMVYSIPGNLRLIDLDGDHHNSADRFYFGDTGGQLWRCDFSVGAVNRNVIDCDVIFNASKNNSRNQDRRFFETPDVSVVTLEDGTRKVAVAIGSGDRANLKGQTVRDGFYVVHDGFGEDSIQETLTPADLFNATNTLYGELSANKKEQEKEKYQNGWRIDLRPGEKVVSTPATFAGVTYFTTYKHESNNNANSCVAGGGTARLYSVSKADGMPAASGGGVPTVGDRVKELKVATIPASPAIFRVADEQGVLAAKGAQVCVGLECQAAGGQRAITSGHFDNME